MSATAFITMIASWVVITFFAVRFLIKVIRTPMKKDDGQLARPGG